MKLRLDRFEKLVLSASLLLAGGIGIVIWWFGLTG